MLKADFHIHTTYSMDCNTSLEDIIDRCLKTNINCIAVSDHGTIEGALKMQSLAPFKVIVSEEILTPHGEIMGIFLKEGIPSGVSIEEAVSQIKAQDGLVGLPHPFDPLRGLRLDNNRLGKLAEQLDVIEVFNARSPISGPATRARAFAAKYDLPGTVGSDAHTIGEIGYTYIEMDDFNDKAEFLQSLRKGKLYTRKSSYMVHFFSIWAKIKYRLFG